MTRQRVIPFYIFVIQKFVLIMPRKISDLQLDLFPSEPSVEEPLPHYDHTLLFERLSKSDFRSRFHLSKEDRAYIREKGRETIRRHAADFIAERLAPASIPNDGRQTPMRGHPVFKAQHATACCCRGCFEKWHHIPAGRALSPAEQQYAVSVLMEWIQRELHG